MSNFSVQTPRSAHSSVLGLGRFGQQILNLLDLAGTRAATQRQLLAMNVRELDDCGMTLADVDLGLPDLYANDFRVAYIGERRAA